MTNLLPISNRTVMLDVNGVRAARGCSTEKVNALIEVGELQWVFDLSRGSQTMKHIRHLRFWAPEITDASTVAGLSLEKVITKILPMNRARFNGGEIGQWFLVSSPTVCRIGAELQGELQGGVWHVTRARLADYLRSRWSGASQVKGGFA